MEFFINEIHAVSDYFKRVDNGNNERVDIVIAKDESDNDKPRHLIITGINGTGKTVLLEGVNQWLRDYFSKNFTMIEVNKDDMVSVELSHYHKFDESKNKVAYFEPLYITESEMFRPARGLNMYDYTDLFIRIANNSDVLRDNLFEALQALYVEEFENFEFDVAEDCGKIKLIGREPFSITHMSSGHYSFLNVYCHIRFTQVAFNWENDVIWDVLPDKITTCIELIKKISSKVDEYKLTYTGKHARPLAAMHEGEPKRIEALKEARSIAESRRNNPAGRSRKRDRDLILDISHANSAVKNQDYKKVLDELPDIGIAKEFRQVSEILQQCSDMLLGGKTSHEDFPLIVLIDEPESHLHIALQREVMPYLAKRFHNVQFIIATHSPFVITSLPDATLFNMENRKPLRNDLTLYSYESVVEGWFGLYLCSNDTKEKYEEFKKLADS
jgi:predicted ATPase